MSDAKAPQRWLITGGCGFIGRNLIAHLARQGGHEIRVVDNFSEATPDELSDYAGIGTVVRRPDETGSSQQGSVDVVQADVLDRDAAARIVEGCDAVVHLAANTGVGPSIEDPFKDCAINVTGTLNYLEAARHAGVARFVFASSGAPLGEVEPPLHEQIAPKPVSPYGASKLAGEGYCSAYGRSFGLGTVALRFGNVYGPGSTHKSSVVAKFIRAALAGEVLDIYGDGSQTRDFIYVGDLIDAVCKAATREVPAGETFQIATSAETSVREVVECLKTVFGRHGIPEPEVTFSEPRLGDVKRNFSLTTKAAEILDWHSTTGLAEGLDNTVAWFTSAQGAGSTS